MKQLMRHVLIFVFVASIMPSVAQMPESDEALWEQLNAYVVQAFQDGRYGDGVPLAEEAYRLANALFGEAHPLTLSSLNNLAGFYSGLGRFSDAEPLYKQALERRRKVLGERHPDTLSSLNNLAFFYNVQGRFADAEPIYRQALQLSREILGETHVDTLSSVNDMAGLYFKLGRYRDAEPFYEQALQLSREVLGETHPDTLSSLNGLALLYSHQGRFSDAEPLLKQALERRLEMLGETHADTLTSRNNLATLYMSQGRYGEAESIYEQTLRLQRELLGETHLDTLGTQNNLATLYAHQQRYEKAETLYQQALELSREALGEIHPDTLAKLNNLAFLYHRQGRYADAEPLFQEALRLSRELLGETHPNTLTSLHNLASLYSSQNRYDDAEPLFKQALQQRLEVLGEAHPDVLGNLNNLAGLYRSQGRYGDAEPLYKQALDLAKLLLGQSHPQTLITEINYAGLLVQRDELSDAVTQLRRTEPQRLAWIGAELYSTRAGQVQSQLLNRQSTFQDMVLTLGINSDDSQALKLAGDVMLRWKQLWGAEQAYLARLLRTENDPEIRALGDEIASLRAKLARIVQETTPAENPSDLLKQLEVREQELAQASRAYKDYLEVSRAGLSDVQAVMPAESVLIEFRQYWPVDFASGSFDAPRWAAMLVHGQDRTILEDVGSIEESSKLLSAMVQQEDIATADKAAAALHAQLFGVFAGHLNGIETVYIAADGHLSLVPFERLRLADGRYWSEAQELRFIQTGRELLSDPIESARGKGLLALGGIDFGDKAMTDDEHYLAAGLAEDVEETKRGLRNALDATRSQVGGFTPLDGSKLEVGFVRAAFELHREEEPIRVWTGKEASEARLKSLDDGSVPPPRVLHLATHGFYLSETETRLSRPQLYSGLALAGANLALSEEQVTADDGILYSLEAQGLNLEGTELVVLSACETGQGSLDYSEGVVSLVHALRIAGAENVLMTLWPVGDHEAKDFMRRFYDTWLSNSSRTPAEALAMTKAHYQSHSNPKLADPRNWAPYVLIEG